MNRSHDSFLILLWNSNGLSRHKDELEILLHDRRIDAGLITETHLTTNSHISIKDYKLYRTDHPDGTAHGGTSIFLKNSLSHFPLPSFSRNFLQATSVSVNFKGGPVTISSCYCPPNKQITQGQFLSYFSSLGPKFISGGDYNAKHPQWGCRVSNPRGQTLHSTISTTSYKVITPPQPPV